MASSFARIVRFVVPGAAGSCLLALPSHALQLPGAERPLNDAEISYLTIFAVLIVGYFLPTLVAFVRRHPNRWLILVINVVFGATGLGWLGSLVWAFSAIHRSPTGNHGGESGLNLFVNDGPVQAIPSATSPGDQLLRLKTLLDQGAITSEEYGRLRKPLIDKL